MFRKFILLTTGLFLLAACGTVATPVYQEDSDAAGVDAIRTIAPTDAPTETPLPTLPPTNTPVPPTETPLPTEAPTETPLPEPTATSTDIPAAEPEAEASAGDAANGDVLFHEMRTEVSFSCAVCHSTDTNMRLIGPGLLDIGEIAATRIDGMSAEDYLRESILHPDNYIVEDENGVPYPAGLMPQTYADVWTDEQVEDLIAYLLGL